VVEEVAGVGYNFGVGREAPLFSLTAHDGTVVSLSRYRGDWYPLIVFFSATAPGVGDYLRELDAAIDELWGMRGQVLAVAVAPQADLRDLAGRAGTLAFPLLSDDGTVARLYGTWDEARRDCIPMAFVADRAHKIVWAGNGDGTLPPSVAELQQAFRGLVK
jgi:peroxiredoxin